MDIPAKISFKEIHFPRIEFLLSFFFFFCSVRSAVWQREKATVWPVWRRRSQRWRWWWKSKLQWQWVQLPLWWLLWRWTFSVWVSIWWFSLWRFSLWRFSLWFAFWWFRRVAQLTQLAQLTQNIQFFKQWWRRPWSRRPSIFRVWRPVWSVWGGGGRWQSVWVWPVWHARHVWPWWGRRRREKWRLVICAPIWSVCCFVVGQTCRQCVHLLCFLIILDIQSKLVEANLNGPAEIVRPYESSLYPEYLIVTIICGYYILRIFAIWKKNCKIKYCNPLLFR